MTQEILQLPSVINSINEAFSFSQSTVLKWHFHLYTYFNFYAKINNYTHAYNTTAYILFFFKRNSDESSKIASDTGVDFRQRIKRFGIS